MYKQHDVEKVVAILSPAIYFLFIILLISLYDNKKVTIKQMITSKYEEDNLEMKELAKRFIGTECLIYTYNSQITGVIKEVTDGAILVENHGTDEAVNLDFVTRIREYPKKKNGKKKSVIFG